ncbi:WS/DGAT/MGAT family O-acyltransferase [Propionibacteriaceae bacterium Y2011]|uniref:WS/DGAT/MGAT family O-acyltransferase n=1 Tax=Microlunatus sp. Y2014 TaxID=3418488 RepID=UPI003B4F9653
MDRLSRSEESLLALDATRHPAHTGAVHVFAGDDLFAYEDLVALVQDRIAFVPRYRQRVRALPGGLAAPVWVDDVAFDLTYHLRRSALPRPGTPEQLREFLGRVMSRRLDRNRPLWELYLVEGLADNRFALVSKTHLALVDGVDTVDLGQVLLDEDPAAPVERPVTWEPNPEPGGLDLLVAAAYDGVRDPARALGGLRRGVTGVLGTAVAVGDATGGLGATFGDLAASALMGTAPAQASPFIGAASEQRRFAGVRARVDDLKAVRSRLGHTINDVVLAIITGGLRGWLQHRGENIGSVLALVPMSVVDADDQPSSLGCRVAPHLTALPVGESRPAMRVHQIAIATQAHKDTGVAVDARTLTDLAGFAPATLHALGVRAGYETVRRRYDLVVTNVPGPRSPVYAAGAQLEESFPVVPLGQGHLMAIGVTSYDGGVGIGITGDRDRLSDIDVLAQCMEESIEELVTDAQREATP